MQIPDLKKCIAILGRLQTWRRHETLQSLVPLPPSDGSDPVGYPKIMFLCFGISIVDTGAVVLVGLGFVCVPENLIFEKKNKSIITSTTMN